MTHSPSTIRRRYDIRGQVQGVGFRPFVYRLACAYTLTGHVSNDANGAQIEVEGPPDRIVAFEAALHSELPPLAAIANVETTERPPLDQHGFRIIASSDDGTRRPEVTPDAATCADCLRELRDPANRRYSYAFINCTNCGPRYSIIRDVPYDRPNTTMSAFTMCPACQAEYDNPADRRFHAQPNACPVCGPQLAIEVVRDDRPSLAPLPAAVELLRQGAIVAIKGLGGVHLACDATSEAAVQRMRTRKLRDGKPLAIMVPDVAAARRLCRTTSADIDTLIAPAAPIVLIPKQADHGVAESVAPGCADLGLMLPYTPLHHLLFDAGLGPLVLTSANLSGQPLTYRNEDALEQLSDVADAFLLHNRPIHRPVDDSVAFTFRDTAIPLRRARGYAPRPIPVAVPALHRPPRVLAVGGELKSTVCLLRDGEAIVSEHLGDLSGPATYRNFVAAIERLKQLWAFEPDVVACDLHPNYLSTQYARQTGRPVIPVQHHHAHIAAIMAEHQLNEPVVGLACDGTGYGTDGTIWGCELLLCSGASCERLAHLKTYPLVGGDRATLETWRPAAALLRPSHPDTWKSILRTRDPKLTDEMITLFEQQFSADVNAPRTSSLGRVFDAVSYLLGLCTYNRHEAEAAMALEAAARDVADGAPWPYFLDTSSTPWTWSLDTALSALLNDATHTSTDQCARRFHLTIANMLATGAMHACKTFGVRHVALAGGCFLNRVLLTEVTGQLENSGATVWRPGALPPGDGSIALGQAWVAALRP